MFYIFKDEIETANIEIAKASPLALGFINDTEVTDVCRLFNLPLNPQISPDITYIDITDSRIIITASLVLIVSPSQKVILPIIQKALSHLNPDNATSALIVSAFLSEMLNNLLVNLSQYQTEISQMEKKILNDNYPQSLQQFLYCKKQALLSQANKISTITDSIHNLISNDEELFDDSEIKSFEILLLKTQRQGDNIKILIDNVDHLRDVYHAGIDLRLNKTMKVFTVVTVIFAPLSFITGWFGMNFKNMPLLSLPFGYIIAIVLCIVVTIGLLLWFKHKGWL